MQLTAAILCISLALPINILQIGTGLDQRVDRVFAAYDNADSPGCVFGAIRNGNFIYRKAYEMGSLELVFRSRPNPCSISGQYRNNSRLPALFLLRSRASAFPPRLHLLQYRVISASVCLVRDMLLPF
jgi:hypothetical protein